jgi:hypothetical protein
MVALHRLQENPRTMKKPQARTDKASPRLAQPRIKIRGFLADCIWQISYIQSCAISCDTYTNYWKRILSSLNKQAWRIISYLFKT